MIYLTKRIWQSSPGVLLIAGGLLAICTSPTNAIYFPNGVQFVIPGVRVLTVGPTTVGAFCWASAACGALAVFVGLCRFILGLYATSPLGEQSRPDL